ncbi:MAG: glycosyltransferase family 4 protein [Bacteroides sp.]|nr:glycosyltransferase family 4 protein [Bacteroides sp.]
MIIGIDYRLANSTWRGMGRYCREIVDCLIEIDKYNNYVLFFDGELRDSIKKENVRYVRIPTANYIIGEQVWLPFMVHREKCDILWCPNNTFPIFLSKRVRLFTTIHDLIFFYQNDGIQSFKQKIGKIYRKFILKKFSYRINECFTVSEYSKGEIEKYLNIKCKIGITPNCIKKFSDKIKSYLQVHSVCKKSYFFTLSGDAPSKNLDVLINVFIKEFPDEKLIIGGVGNDSIFRSYESSQIQFLQAGISDDRLIQSYLESRCFLFCSKYEGFGIPVLEAMACGIPIISSNTTSLPEILDGSGYLVEPTYEGICNGIRDFLNHINCKMLNYDRILNRYYDWHNSAKVILDKY